MKGRRVRSLNPTACQVKTELASTVLPVPLVCLWGPFLWGGSFRETLLDVTAGTVVGCSS